MINLNNCYQPLFKFWYLYLQARCTLVSTSPTWSATVDLTSRLFRKFQIMWPIHMPAMCGYAVLRGVTVPIVRPVDVGSITGGSTLTSCWGSVHIPPALILMRKKDISRCIYTRSMGISQLFSVTKRLRLVNAGWSSPLRPNLSS